MHLFNDSIYLRTGACLCDLCKTKAILEVQKESETERMVNEQNSMGFDSTDFSWECLSWFF